MASSSRFPRLTGTPRLLAYAAASVAILVGFGAALRMSDGDVRVMFVLIAAAMFAVLAVSFWWWRGVDEAVKEAHKAAWFWGGLIAVCIATPFLIFLYTTPDAAIAARALDDDAAGLILTGVLGCLTVQLIGYSIAWAAWWLRRR